MRTFLQKKKPHSPPFLDSVPLSMYWQFASPFSPIMHRILITTLDRRSMDAL